MPGLFAPQPVLDRRCMDGGVSGTGIHTDLVAGTERALVFPPRRRAARTPADDPTRQHRGEIAELRAAGTAVEVRHARFSETTNLMDPAEVPAAFALGALQAGEDADAPAGFW